MNTQERISDMAAFRAWVTAAKRPVKIRATDGTVLGQYSLTGISAAAGTQTWTAVRNHGAPGEIHRTKRFRTADAAAAFVARATKGC